MYWRHHRATNDVLLVGDGISCSCLDDMRRVFGACLAFYAV